VETLKTINTGDDVETITAEIQKAIQAGSQMVLCTGGMSVDPGDKTPAALRPTPDPSAAHPVPLPRRVMTFRHRKVRVGNPQYTATKGTP